MHPILGRNEYLLGIVRFSCIENLLCQVEFLHWLCSIKPFPQAAVPQRSGNERRKIVCADAFVLSNHHLLKVLFLLGSLDLGFPTPLDRCLGEPLLETLGVSS